MTEKHQPFRLIDTFENHDQALFERLLGTVKMLHDLSDMLALEQSARTTNETPQTRAAA